MEQNLLDIYTDYLISQNHYATATGLAHLLDHHISHDKITRFLNKNLFDSKHLWEYVKKQVRQYEQPTAGALIIDDSIMEKPYTDENNIISWHYSHAKGSYVKGINLLSCLIRYGDIALPISFDIVTKDISCIDPVTQKQKRRSSLTKNERFRALLKQAVKNQVSFEYVLADSWFGAKDNMQFIHYELKKKFIFGIKSNRLVALTGQAKKEEQYHPLHALGMQDNEKKVVFLKDISFPVAIIKKVFTNGDGSQGILYLVSNDVEKDAELLYQVYQKRWRIEEYHKSIKVNASLEKSPTKVECSQRNHIFSVIVAYCKLELLRIKTTLNPFALKYKLLVKANQLAFQELQKFKSILTAA